MTEIKKKFLLTNRGWGGGKTELGTPPNNEIWYRTSDGVKIDTKNYDFINTSDYNMGIFSNTYENGKGILFFNDSVTRIKESFKDKDKLTHISLPSTISKIDNYAFLWV